MREFIKKNPWFSFGFTIMVILVLFLVNLLGFLEMVENINHIPERLRDFTFPIWDGYSFSQHGYLVFLSLKDFEAGVAYSNHSSIFLFFIYIFYMVEKGAPLLPMRVVVANIEMILNVMILMYIVFDGWKEKIKFHHGVLIVLSLVFFITLPDFWISAGKFNVDNPLHFQFLILLLVAHRLSQGIYSGVRLWLPLGAHCLVSPMGSVLLALYLLVYSIKNDRVDRRLFILGILVILVSIIVYLQPVLISKYLGFTSVNSGWLFRSGLDGQTNYFRNIVQAIVKPFFPRPVLLLVIPIALLMFQHLYAKFYNSDRVYVNVDGECYRGDLGLFYGVIFSQYLLTCLLWPQAISIHPYGYDYMLLAPISVCVVFNFAYSEILYKNSRVWIFVLSFFILFNLQQISKAGSCVDCYYP